MAADGTGTIWINSNFPGDENDSPKHLMIATSESAINMVNMAMDKPSMRSFPAVLSYFLVGGLVISLVSGSYFKGILYRGLFKGKLLDRPINILLLCGAVIHHSTHLIAGISLIVTIAFDVSLEETLGPAYCFFELCVCTFGLVNLSVGSLGIAIYRILYIRCNNWAKYRVGERLLLVIILLGSLALATFITALFVIEPSSKRSLHNGCLGHSERAHSIIIEYRRSQGMLAPIFCNIQMCSLSIMHWCLHLHILWNHLFVKCFLGFETANSSTYQIVAVIMTMCCTISEIICYILFFHHVYRNDNGDVKKMLDPQVTKQRNRKNLTSFLGQFFAFMTEITFLVVFLIILIADSSNTTTKSVAVVIKFMEFGGLSLVEIISSDELRTMMHEDWKKIKSMFTLF